METSSNLRKRLLPLPSHTAFYNFLDPLHSIFACNPLLFDLSRHVFLVSRSICIKYATYTLARFCSTWKQSILILCGNAMSLFSKISYFICTGKGQFQLREAFQKSWVFDDLKCRQCSLIYGRFKEMMLLAVETGRNSKTKLQLFFLYLSITFTQY